MPSPLFGRYAAVGFEFTGSVGLGFFAGRAVDQHWQTHGTALWIGFFLGISSGFALLVRAARQLEKEADDDEKIEREKEDENRLRNRLEQVEKEIEQGEADEANRAAASKGNDGRKP